MKKLRRILLSNDDGIGSPFLKRFFEAFEDMADEVVCVVPAHEQSWIGRAYSRHKTLTLADIGLIGKVRVYTIDGTPADCVNIALGHLLEEKPDAVISGMNIGQNLAMPLLWSSGTFAAAVEGAACGVPAFAVSMQLAAEHYELCRLRHAPPPESLDASLKQACAHASDFIGRTLKSSKDSPKPYTVYNINYPAGYDSDFPFKFCEPAKVEIRPLYKRAATDKFEFKYAIGDDLSKDGVLTDIECIKRSWASCSIISIAH